MPCAEEGWAGELSSTTLALGIVRAVWQFRRRSSFQSPPVLEWLGFLVAGAKALLDGGLMLPSFPSPAVRTPPASESNATARV